MLLVLINDRHSFRGPGQCFTRQLLALLRRFSVQFRIRFTEDIAQEEWVTADITHVISGGSQFHLGLGCPSTVTENNQKVLNICRQRIIPWLGICFGCQWLNMAYGGHIQKREVGHHGDRPVWVSHSQLTTCGAKILVREAHDYELKHIPIILNITAIDKCNEIAMLEHETLPFFGTQFHPEASGDIGWTLIDTFLHIEID